VSSEADLKSSNCYDACANLIARAIDEGASDVQCDDYEVFAQCWMGYL
jgi:hypothetical protein